MGCNRKVTPCYCIKYNEVLVWLYRLLRSKYVFALKIDGDYSTYRI